MVVASLRPNNEIFRDPGYPARRHCDTARTTPRAGPPCNVSRSGRYLINSDPLRTRSILGNLVACSWPRYAFARLEFRSKRLLFAIMLVTIMLPFHVLIPQYILFSKLGWVNTSCR